MANKWQKIKMAKIKRGKKIIYCILYANVLWISYGMSVLNTFQVDIELLYFVWGELIIMMKINLHSYVVSQ